MKHGLSDKDKSKQTIKLSEETLITETDYVPTINTLDELQFALADVLHTEDPSLEISENLMKIILKGQKSPYVTYHGVKLFIKGTRETIEQLEEMTPSQKVEFEKSKK